MLHGWREVHGKRSRLTLRVRCCEIEVRYQNIVGSGVGRDSAETCVWWMVKVHGEVSGHKGHPQPQPN